MNFFDFVLTYLKEISQLRSNFHDYNLFYFIINDISYIPHSTLIKISTVAELCPAQLQLVIAKLIPNFSSQLTCQNSNVFINFSKNPSLVLLSLAQLSRSFLFEILSEIVVEICKSRLTDLHILFCIRKC